MVVRLLRFLWLLVKVTLKAIGWTIVIFIATVAACIAAGPIGMLLPPAALWMYWTERDQGNAPPLTDEEARIAAGMDSVYECASFHAWRRLRQLQRYGLITWDARTGVIRHGPAGFSKKRAKKGLPQVDGWVRCTPKGDPGSEVYNADYADYARYFGGHQLPPKAAYHGGP